MKNQVIKVKSIEHGKRVEDYFKSKGIDISNYPIDGVTEQGGFACIYFGVINDNYENYSLREVKNANAEIITLPEEKPYPKMMMVWDSQADTKFKALVIGYFNGFYIADTNREEVCNDSSFYPYEYAEDIPEKIKVTREEIADWKGVDKDLIEIV